MKKKLRVLLFALSLGVLALVLAVRLGQRGTTLFGARLADAGQLAALQAGQQVSSEGCILHWNGAVLPYDTVALSYVLAQPLSGEPRGTLSAGWGNVYLDQSEWAVGLLDRMESGEPFSVYVSDGVRWCRLSAYLTGLPTLAIQTKESVPYTHEGAAYSTSIAALELAYNYSDYTLLWPGGNSRQQVTSGSLEWHWRGNSSLFAKKKTYAINLLKANGTSKSEDWLGLGDDSNWILLNLATDCTRAREKVSWQLWSQLSAFSESWNIPGMQVEYVELYLNDTYLGVYGLCRPVSYKTLGLSGNDRLYKWRKDQLITPEVFEELEKEQELAWKTWLDVAWPKTWKPGVWDQLESYVEQFYRGAPANYERIAATTQLDNLIDVALYKQFVCGIDNVMQNQYILYSAADGTFYRLPWDMDYTFGDVYIEGAEERAKHEAALGGESTESLRKCDMDLARLAIPDMELDTLYEADPARTQRLVAGRWAELRENVFTAENLEALFRAATAELQASGALEREYTLWNVNHTYPQNPPPFKTLDLEETLEFMERRLEFLDQYMQHYTPPSRESFNGLPQ